MPSSGMIWQLRHETPTRRVVLHEEYCEQTPQTTVKQLITVPETHAHTTGQPRTQHRTKRTKAYSSEPECKTVAYRDQQ